MAEYVEREAAEKAIAVLMPRMSTPDGTGCGDEYILSAQEAFVDAIAAVNNIPAAEVAPVSRWISVADKMPEEHDSIFVRLHGTKNWMNGMCKSMSSRVIVTTKDEYGKKLVVTGHTADGEWKIDCLIPGLIVTHWMPMPEPPKMDLED